jgi:hypothetical protein
MKFAVIENNVVVNIAEAASAIVPSWVQSDTAKIGDIYDGGSFITPPPDSAELEHSHREARNRLLAETDWVVVFHTEKGTNIPLEWATYRQALRDITAQEGFPHSVVWPTKP